MKPAVGVHHGPTPLLLFLVAVLILTACSPSTPSNGDAVPITGGATAPVPASTQAASAASSTPAAQASSTQAASTSTADPGKPAASVTAFPDPSSYTWNPVAAGLTRPTALIAPRDGSGRLFVLEQAGTIMIIQNGQVLPQPFLDITSEVRSSGSEQGLLGMDFSPHYTSDGLFYVNYIDQNGNTMVARFKVSSDPNAADPRSEQTVLKVNQPYANHNGGGVVFGPDGYLYLSFGDGGSAGDPHRNGQSTNTLLGKLLRIDVSRSKGYTIPPDNPFAKGGGKPEIWAYGLRNPWRFSFDSRTNDLYIADVGQDLYEEIDFQPAGAKGGLNYGWNIREGLHPYKGEPPAGAHLVDPVFEYSHAEGCSVTGGYVYRGQKLPAFNGVYLFGDYCSGNIWGLLRSGDSWQAQQLFSTRYNITSFGQDQNGEIYLLDQTSASVLRLEKK